MRSVVGSLAGIAGGVLVVIVILAINGGYVYRTQCPRVGGSTETDWTYHIYSVVPFFGYSRSGCEVHTAPRVALDAIGIWKLGGSGEALAATAPDHRDEYTAEQRTQIASHCVDTGKSMSFCECVADE